MRKKTAIKGNIAFLCGIKSSLFKGVKLQLVDTTGLIILFLSGKNKSKMFDIGLFNFLRLKIKHFLLDKNRIRTKIVLN